MEGGKERREGGGRSDDNLQFYFDSAAGRWWFYDEAQESWVPWEEENGESNKEGVSQRRASAANSGQDEEAGSSYKREQEEEGEDYGDSIAQEPGGEGGDVRKRQDSSSSSSNSEKQNAHLDFSGGLRFSSPFTAKEAGGLRREALVASSSPEEKIMDASTNRRRNILDSLSSRHSLDDVILGLAGEGLLDTTGSGGSSSSLRSFITGGGGGGGEGRASTLQSFNDGSEGKGSGSGNYLLSLARGARNSDRSEGNLLGKRLSSNSDEDDDEEAENRHEEDDDDDEDDEEIHEPEKIPFVRRSTRMLTFKDKGGLAGCLKEAAAQRKSLIEESGGLVPGTEEHRQEEWKRRARELATQSHVRAQRRWLDAARRASNTSGNGEDEKKILHFSDLVHRVRRQSRAESDTSGGGASAIDQLASSPAALTVPTPPPPGVLDRIDPLAAAANLLHKPEVDLREQRRRSSGFAGGQQGYVRFADATLRDPNYHLQFQDLLTQQQGGKKRSGSLGETGSVGSGGGGDSSIASPTGEGSYTTGSHSRESGEEK